MRLDKYDKAQFDRGRSRLVEVLWLICQALLVRSWIPGTVQRVWLLRLFGAKIGKGVVIQPGVRVKFPWRLEIGQHSWIGNGVWLDNLATIRIGSHCSVSQDAYFCTGSHHWLREGFDLMVSPIIIEDKVWICAKSVVGPGVRAQEGAVLALGSVATGDLKAWRIYQGVPAMSVKRRGDD